MLPRWLAQRLALARNGAAARPAPAEDAVVPREDLGPHAVQLTPLELSAVLPRDPDAPAAGAWTWLQAAVVPSARLRRRCAKPGAAGARACAELDALAAVRLLVRGAAASLDVGSWPVYLRGKASHRVEVTLRALAAPTPTAGDVRAARRYHQQVLGGRGGGRRRRDEDATTSIPGEDDGMLCTPRGGAFLGLILSREFS